jgi:hypothetical protein
MTKPLPTPEVVGFRADAHGVNMVFNIGTDAELRMIVPAEAAIAWGRQLMLLGLQVQEEQKHAMALAVGAAMTRSLYVARGVPDKPDG